MLKAYDAVYIDACTWMSPEMETFLREAQPSLESFGKKLIVIPSVYRELENCSSLKYAAQVALDLIRRFDSIVQREEGESNATTADRDFLRILFFNHHKRNQLLVTQDQQLAADIQNCCRSVAGEAEASVSRTDVMTLWGSGELIRFDEMFRRKEAQAREKLEEMVGNSPVYMDSTALLNANARLFLDHIAAPMRHQGKSIQILRNSLEAGGESARLLLDEAGQGLVNILPGDASLTETNALLGELYLSESNVDAERLVLVTDDMMRANELRLRRPKCDRFPFVDFMVINKYGFLSYLKLTDAPSPSSRPKPYPYPKANVPPPPFSPNMDKKPSSYVPQLIGAIKNEDIEAMCSYIEKGANLRNGIITALCHGKDHCLEVMLDHAEQEIEPSCFQWWVVSYYSFGNPFYLDEDNGHYELMQKLIAKSGSMESLREAMIYLARLVSLPRAAHERLWHIIRLAAEKGAPVNVISPETKESLLAIARRQHHGEMERFLEARMKG